MASVGSIVTWAAAMLAVGAPASVQTAAAQTGSVRSDAVSNQSVGAASSNVVSGVTVTAHRANAVDGLTVTSRVCPEPDAVRYAASAPPEVVDTYPAQDATVAPGPLTVRITFSAPMACYWATVSEGGGDTACQHAVTWDLPGRTTLRMQCTVVAGARYKMLFGAVGSAAGPLYFVGLSGREAKPFTLHFRTADADSADVERPIVDVGPPGTERVTAHVTCTDLPLGVPGVPCKRVGG